MKEPKRLDRIFPLLFLLYPFLALLAANQNYVNFDDIYRSVLVSLVVVGLVWIVLKWILKSWIKAGVLVSMGAVLFFSYGHVYLLALDQFGEGFSHLYLVLIYLILGLVFGGLTVFRMGEQSPIPGILGMVGLVLVGFSLFQIGFYQVQLWRGSSRTGPANLLEGQSAENLPDVYLVILDAHTRSDVLLDDYDLDNSDFISALEEIGFYVADCSQSNYPKTDLALQSLFNLEYVHEFIEEGEILPGLKNSSVKRTFDSAGYTTYAFNNYFSSHYDLGEDELLGRKASITESVNLFVGLNEYESLVVETSMLRLLVDFQYALGNYFGGALSDQGKFYSHYLETKFILEELENLPTRSGRKFVFAHIAVPHWPFVFSEEGEYEHIWGLPDEEGYRKNVVFIDRHIPGIMEEIIAQSDTPPVIILMGDHGPTGDKVPIENRMSNLYAVYADGEVLSQLYPSITPVNSFRLILNHYFSTDYDLLEDISYNIWNNESYNLEEVIPNMCAIE